MQNLPKKDGFREILLAPPGHLLVIADSASIEARVLAWLAEQQDLLEIFWQKGDPYKTMAATIYGKPETEITKEERTLGKVAVLGCGYGMGASKFQATAKTYGIDIDFDLAQLAVTTYRQTNKSIVDLWRFLDGMIPFMQKQALSLIHISEPTRPY